MRKAPNLYHLEDLPRTRPLADATPLPRSDVCIHGQWVPARPMGYFSLISRVHLGWMVFTGKADALLWPGGQ